MRVVGRVVSYVVLVIIGLLGIAPFVYLALMSTKTRLDILEVPPALSFDWETIKANYDVVINDDKFLTMVKNSIIVTGLSTLLALVIGVPAAYAFSRLRFRGREQWSTTILSFRFMPPVAVAIPIFLMMRKIGLEDSFTGLILPYVAFSLPLTVWIMIGFFDEIPRELDDAALVDGCVAARRSGARAAAAGPAGHGRGRDLRRDLHLERVPRRALRHHVAGQADRADRRLGAAHDAEPDRLEHRRRRRRADDDPDPDLLDLRPALHRPRHDRGRDPLTVGGGA